ncbi:hypothetical protein KR026_006933, partial [Drosophila bipectinata]
LAVFNLLLSICLIFAIFAPWAMGQFSSLSPPDPTPPTGSPSSGSSTVQDGPPVASSTPAVPLESTIYPIY